MQSGRRTGFEPADEPGALDGGGGAESSLRLEDAERGGAALLMRRFVPASLSAPATRKAKAVLDLVRLL